MYTQNPNSSNSGKSRKASSTDNGGVNVAIGTAAAVVGSGSTVAAMTFIGDDPVIEAGEVDVTPELEVAKVAKDVAASATSEPEEKAEEPKGKTAGETKPGEGVKEENKPGEEDKPGEEGKPGEDEKPGEEGKPSGEDPEIQDPENPEDIANAIISDNQEDTGEYQIGAQVQFVSVGEVYDEAGNQMTAAHFIDQDGDEGVMLDKDQDGYFDEYQYDGMPCSWSAEGLNLAVSDAEEQINQGYIDPSAELAQMDNEMGDDYLGDIIEPENIV